MEQWDRHLATADDTVALGVEIGNELTARYDGNALVWLRGQLGAGKTTLVSGILRACGHSGVVKSPTYTLLEPYALNGQDAYHFDLYRVADPEELAFIGFDEIIDGPGLKLIEWPEHADSWLPEPDVTISLTVELAENDSQNTIARCAHVQFT